jgi:hypothetical protein
MVARRIELSRRTQTDTEKRGIAMRAEIDREKPAINDEIRLNRRQAELAAVCRA